MNELANEATIECPPAIDRAPRWDSLRNGRTAAALLLAIIAGGVVLRTYGLYGRSMWFDESMSWWTIQFPFGEMLKRTARNSHVPLFFVLLRWWTDAFGGSIVALRNFSLAMSAPAMLGVYLFTVEAMRMRCSRGETRLSRNEESPYPLPLSGNASGKTEPSPDPRPVSGNASGKTEPSPDPRPLSLPVEYNGRERGDVEKARWVGLAATALFAVSLFQVRMAWEIRMYSLGTALAMFSSWLLLRALTARPPRRMLWALYMLTGLGLAYTHYCGLFSLFAQALFALGFLLYAARWRFKPLLKDVRFRWLALAYAGMAAGWGAWLPVFIEQRRRVATDWHHNTPFSLKDVPGMCYEMFFDPEAHGRVFSYQLIVTGLCGLVLLLILWRGRAGQWCIACLAVVPLGLITLASAVSSNLLIARYMAFLQPFLLIAIAVALGKIPVPALRDLIAYGLVAAGLLLHVDYVDSFDIPNRPGASAAAAYIDAHRGPGEPVIGCSSLVLFPTHYHARDGKGWHVYSDRPELPYYVGGPVIIKGDLFSSRDMDAVKAKRAWVVTTSGKWGRWGLYIPPKWVETDEQRFREVHAFQNDVVVKCYRIE